MDINQATFTGHCHTNHYVLPFADQTNVSTNKEKNFKHLFSESQDQKIKHYLLHGKRESAAFARSNKAIRKLENMIDVINFTLFDFELIVERYSQSKIVPLLKDIISILKSAKKSIQQEFIKDEIDLKSSTDIYIMAIYASIKTISQIIQENCAQTERLLENVNSMKISLVYALDEQLDTWSEASCKV